MGLVEWYNLRRGEGRQLSAHFNSREFECHCGLCLSFIVSNDLIQRLEAVRADVGPLRVTSGYRCARYQQILSESGAETAKGISSHEQGMAADIVLSGDKSNKADLDAACLRHFDNVGISHSFVHVDVRPIKLDRGQRIWRYKS